MFRKTRIVFFVLWPTLHLVTNRKHWSIYLDWHISARGKEKRKRQIVAYNPKTVVKRIERIVKFCGISVCTHRVNLVCKGWWTTAAHGQVPGGFSWAEGRDAGPCKTFQWTSITIGWRFTFIRPAAKCLVCIWNLPSTLIHGASSRKSTEYLSLCWGVPRPCS